MGWTTSFFMLIGRFLMAILFFVAVYGKVTNYDATASYMASKGLPMVPLLLGLSILIEFVGGLSLVFGYKVRWLSVILILYLIPVTLIMHDFWMMPDSVQRHDDMFHFFTNLAIIGGLLYIAARGAGFIGFDRGHIVHKKDVEIKR